MKYQKMFQDSSDFHRIELGLTMIVQLLRAYFVYTKKCTDAFNNVPVF